MFFTWPYCLDKAMSERFPSKRDDPFCLSAACPEEREKGKNIFVYPVILSKN
jgi:hypothetical protein